jgi:hypothetical protein
VRVLSSPVTIREVFLRVVAEQLLAHEQLVAEAPFGFEVELLFDKLEYVHLFTYVGDSTQGVKVIPGCCHFRKLRKGRLRQ